MRCTLEKEILKDLSAQLLLPGVHELKEILKKQKEVIGQENAVDSFLNLDDEFHRALYRLAGREYLWTLIQQSNVHYLRYRRLHMLKTDKLEEIWNEHQSILELMVQKETAKIGPLIHHHLREDIHSLDFQENFSEYLKK